MTAHARQGPATGPRSDQTAAKQLDQGQGTATGMTGDRGSDASVREPATRLEWRIRYRRASWQYAETRIFQSEPPARALVRRLCTPSKETKHLADLVELTVEQRQVPIDWLMVDEVITLPDSDDECARWWVEW